MLSKLTKPTRIAIYAATFLVGVLGGQAVFKLLQKQAPGNVAAQEIVGQPGPDFTLPDLDKATHTLHEWDGKVVVVNFWATWCPPCRKETPLFVELQETFGASGLQFVGVAIDTEDKVREFMDTYGVNYPMLIGDNDAVEIAKHYGNRFGALPYTVVMDRSGIVRLVQRGELSREMAEQAIRPLL
jgi:peroxiredoxin